MVKTLNEGRTEFARTQTQKIMDLVQAQIKAQYGNTVLACEASNNGDGTAERLLNIREELQLLKANLQ